MKQRIERDGAGISDTEFTYIILQSFDFAELNKRFDCELQIGGSDQWGNITGGIDLTRRMNGASVQGLTMPLVTKADGTKFGKTAGGAVWLDAAKTSPYSFYQFWLNTADADAIGFLRTFTFLENSEIDALATSLAEEPQARAAQQALAREVTGLVHGQQAVEGAQRISQALFAGDLALLTASDLGELEQDGMDATYIEGQSIGLLEAMAQAGLAASKGAARKLVQGGGVRLNGDVVSDHDAQISSEGGLHGKYHLLRRGKKTWHLLVHRA